MQPSLDQVLDEAADIISQPQSWTRGVDQRPSKGSPCGTKFCLRGALIEAADRCEVSYYGAFDAVQSEINRRYDGGLFTSWNDSQRDKRKVVRLLRRTARRLRAGKV